METPIGDNDVRSSLMNVPSEDIHHNLLGARNLDLLLLLLLLQSFLKLSAVNFDFPDQKTSCHTCQIRLS
jgi:hypothetical protein